MIDTKRITLNKELREKIISNVMKAWREENPKPESSPLEPETAQMYWEYTKKIKIYIKELEEALSVFRNLHQLQHEWPEIMKFIPETYLHPQRIKLPKNV